MKQQFKHWLGTVASWTGLYRQMLADHALVALFHRVPISPWFRSNQQFLCEMASEARSQSAERPAPLPDERS